jgi:hypothetical protein
MISAGLCVIALLSFLQPYAETYVPAGTFAASEADALAGRTVTGFDWLLSREPLLKELGAQTSALPPEGRRRAFVAGHAFRQRGTVKNLFLIPTHNGGGRGMAVRRGGASADRVRPAADPQVDRWIPAGLLAVGALMLATEAVGTLSVDSNYQFLGATYQMMYLGLGGYTLAPLLTAAAAGGRPSPPRWASAGRTAPISSIPSRSQAFVRRHPVPSVGAAVLLALAGVEVNLYTPARSTSPTPP